MNPLNKRLILAEIAQAYDGSLVVCKRLLTDSLLYIYVSSNKKILMIMLRKIEVQQESSANRSRSELFNISKLLGSKFLYKHASEPAGVQNV